MITDNLIDSAAARELAIARIHSMITTCMQIEQQISVSMLAYPSTAHALALMAADGQLGAAVAALSEAERRIARLRP